MFDPGKGRATDFRAPERFTMAVGLLHGRGANRRLFQPGLA